MIQQLRISNYRSLGQDVSLDLGRFTALVGPNGSGKSNVLDAIRFVSDAVQTGLPGAISQRNGSGALRRWSGGHPKVVAISLDLALDAHTTGRYSLELLGELRGDRAEDYRVRLEEAVVKGRESAHFRVERGKWVEGPPGLRPPLDDKSLALSSVGGDPRFQPLVHALQQISVYTISPDVLRAPQKYSPLKPLDRNGSNWASILNDQPESTWKPDLIAALQKLTGDIEDIKISSAASYLVVELLHAHPGRAQKWLDAAQESDGTLRVAGLITALLQYPPVEVIGIEEPELTVHPGAIPLLYDFLKEASLRSQILVTTHSPDLLELIDANDVRVVLRDDDGTTVAPMAVDQRESVRQGLLSLGDILKTEGFQQDLAVPGVG